MQTSLMDKYSDEEFRRIISESFSYKDCMKSLGYNAISGTSLKLLKNKIQRLEIDTTHFKAPIPRKLTKDDVFVQNATVTQKVLRHWYEKESCSEYRCSVCGQLPFWNGSPMTLILDHINGTNNDNRLENLRWVCGNCNMQLETTNGKNIQRLREFGLLGEPKTKKYYCQDCGREIGRTSTRCLSCASKNRVGKDVKITMTIEEYNKYKRDGYSNTKIAMICGVTETAIRKWRKKNGL
jgi:hypothetical protein